MKKVHALFAVAALFACSKDEFNGGEESEAEAEGECPDGQYRCTPGAEADGSFDLCSCEGGSCVWGGAGTCDGACDAASAACENPSCDDGDRQCGDAGTLIECAGGVGGWRNPTACPAGYLCDPTMGNECVPVVCSAGGTSCGDGNTVLLCNDLGTGSEIIETCTGTTKCWEGSCLEPCEIAESERSFIGCLYYGADMDNEDYYDGLDYDVVVANVDPERTATVTVSRRSCSSGEWSPVSGGTATLTPGDSFAFLFGDTHLEGSGLQACGAYKVESTVPIVAYQFNAAIEAGSDTFSANASTLYPKSALEGCAGSSQYYVMTRPAAGGGTSNVTILGTEDATTVNVRAGAAVAAGGGVGAIAAGDSDAFEIDEGDVLQLASSSGDMTGTFVDADKPIAVFGTHETAQVVSGGYGGFDGIEEQMMPLSTWGKRFVAAPLVSLGGGFGGVQPTSWKIMAAEDDTTVTFDPQADCSGLPPSDSVTIATAGQFAEFLTQNASAADPCEFMITSDKPVFIVQFSLWDSGMQGDPAMVTLVPIEQWLSRYTFLAPDYFVDRIRLVRHTASDVLLNGVSVTGAWAPIGSDGDFESLPVAEGAGFANGSNVVEATCAGPKEECGVLLSIEGDGAGCHYGYIGGLNLACIYDPPD